MKTPTQAIKLVLLSLFFGATFTNVSHAMQSVGATKKAVAPDLRRISREILNFELSMENTQAGIGKLMAKDREMAQAENSNEQKRLHLLDRQDKLAISAASFDDVIRLLQIQKVELTIELAGLDARRKILQSIYEEFRNTNLEKFAKTRALLEKLVESQREIFKSAKRLYNLKSLSDSGLSEARAKLLETEIRYEQLDQSVNSSESRELENQLTHLSLDRAEKTAKLQTANRLLQEYTAARPLISEIQQLNAMLDESEESSASRKATLSELRFNLSFESQKQKELQTTLDNWHREIRAGRAVAPYEYELPEERGDK